MPALLLDIFYLLALVLAAPWLLYKAMRTGKYRAGLAQKFFGLVPPRESDRPCVWFHAVSVGEVLMLRRVVALFAQRRPDVDIVVSTTTNTGMELARQHFGNYTLFYFPLDLSWSVRRAIRRVRPTLVVLAELELWPNFIRAARRSGARVSVINGRMSPQSFRGYHRVRFLMRGLLADIEAFAVQTPEYAERFRTVGAPAGRVVVTGSVKYDGIEIDRGNPRTAELRRHFRLNHAETIWVAGSTSEPEEAMVLDAYERLRCECPSLRLVVVPRHKERFDEVAQLIASRGLGLVRRSQTAARADSLTPTTHHSPLTMQSPLTPHRSLCPSVMLVDTLGELSAVWGLADIAFVGGSFAPRGGQNMIEPAGYGAAVLFGPGVWNFQDTIDHLLAQGGAVQLATAEDLESTVRSLVADAARRTALGAAARAFVLSQQGATARTVEILERQLGTGRCGVDGMQQCAA